MRSSTKRLKGRRQKTPVGAFSMSNAGDQIVKRMSSSNSVLATGAGTVIAVTSVSSTNCQVIPAAEWASFAARYQQYRVRAMRITGKATQPVQSATLSHSVLYRGDTIGSSTPATLAQVLSDENVKTVTTCRDFRDIVTWKRNPNAKLWNPTSAAIPVQNTFEWVCASASTPALTTATTYYALVVEWEVEFKGSQ
jgi:hypothetical protein